MLVSLTRVTVMQVQRHAAAPIDWLNGHGILISVIKATLPSYHHL